MENVANIALSAVRGRINGKYSTVETSDALRNAFIEMNGGSTKINPKNFYRGNALYELVQMFALSLLERTTDSKDNR